MMLLRKSIKSLIFAFIVIIPICCSQNISRASFPKGFVFGTASSAYQYEGAVKEDGRGQTIWDTFAHSFGKVVDFSNADVANDQYHRYNEDIQLMKDMGMDAYRFSIAWSRIFPNGTGEINQAGIEHYNNLIEALLSNGIEPYATLYHWDLPQSLHDRYTGWLSPQSIKDYTAYAETCFKEFGDRVKNWITFNEPHTFAVQGYDVGLQAPGRCSILLHAFCGAGNSATEPYIVAHNVLLSHAIKIFPEALSELFFGSHHRVSTSWRVGSQFPGLHHRRGGSTSFPGGFTLNGFDSRSEISAASDPTAWVNGAISLRIDEPGSFSGGHPFLLALPDINFVRPTRGNRERG